LEIDRTSAARPPYIPTNTDPTPDAPPPAARDEAPERPDRTDRIELSGAARDAAQLSEEAREARVAALRAQVQAGTYTADPHATARQLLASDDL
jgi:flagellar biosynthesis anti-sigma factor FlgM